jgi:hypothetical protein
MLFRKTIVSSNNALDVSAHEKAELSGSKYWFPKTESALWIEDEYSELYETWRKPRRLATHG